MDERLTYAEFGEKVGGFSDRQVLRWVQSGKITPRQSPGGKKFFTMEDVVITKKKMIEGTFNECVS